MMRLQVVFLCVVLVTAVYESCLPAQAQPPRRPPIDSPVIHADGTATFKLRAPEAKKVELSGQFLSGNRVCEKDESGVWNVTVGPIEPNLYPYHFVVDGISVADPNNVDVFPNERFKSSLIEVPSSPPALHALQDVPHGRVTYAQYHSTVLECSRRLIIYTPPGYETSSEKYPVLYLISGTTDTEETWFKVGRANFILDNLIAQKKAVPMIIVMPYGNMKMDVSGPATPDAVRMYQRFSQEMMQCIMPFVESNYRTKAERESRAVAGFSRGGGQSLYTGLSNFDHFAWIGSYAAYLPSEACDEHLSGIFSHPEQSNTRLKLLWLGVGKQDFLYEPAVKFDEYLKSKNIQHTSLVTEGGHTWMNARRYLAETLQLFFQPTPNR